MNVMCDDAFLLIIGFESSFSTILHESVWRSMYGSSILIPLNWLNRIFDIAFHSQTFCNNNRIQIHVKPEKGFLYLSYAQLNEMKRFEYAQCPIKNM